MPRPPRIDAPPKRLVRGAERGELLVALPLATLSRMKLFLFSDLEGRVPYGAQSTFVAQAIDEKLDREQQ